MARFALMVVSLVLGACYVSDSGRESTTASEHDSTAESTAPTTCAGESSGTRGTTADDGDTGDTASAGTTGAGEDAP